MFLMGSATALLFTVAGPPARAGEPPTTPSRESSECIVCHAKPEIRTSVGGTPRPELFVPPQDLARSVHAELSCTSCHPPLSSMLHDVPQAEIEQAGSSCDGCHPEQAGANRDGAHGPGAIGPRPTCVACHGSHGVLPAGSRTFTVRANAQCSRCHTEMGERFFGGNPFGMETHLGREDVAVCVDCHDSHFVLPVSDPRSPVNPNNILATCKKCHVSAPPNFADIQIHVAASPLPTDPRLRLVTLYMILILVGTFGLFGAHTALGIRHEWRKRRGAVREGEA